MTVEQVIAITKIMQLDEVTDVSEGQAGYPIKVLLINHRYVHVWTDGTVDWFANCEYVDSSSYDELMKLKHALTAHKEAQR